MKGKGTIQKVTVLRVLLSKGRGCKAKGGGRGHRGGGGGTEGRPGKNK